MLSGVLLVALFSFLAYYMAELEVFRRLSFSPMIVGILLGMLYANTLRSRLPASWAPGIIFCSKTLLRTAIVFYGFRLTVQHVAAIGPVGVVIDAIIVASVVGLGLLVGRALRMDRDLTILTASGSAICGAAAVLGTEPVVRGPAYKTAVAVTTVVLFGTLSMFLYPALYRSGILELTPHQMALYTGSSLHEVAHVVGAGNAMNDATIADSAIVVKMIRVVMLAPFLLLLGLALRKSRAPEEAQAATSRRWYQRLGIPWFAVGFLLMIGFNSLDLLPRATVEMVNKLDTFALTMAMTALGAESHYSKFRQAGAKPFVMALVLYVWLVGMGYVLARYLAPVLEHF